MADEIYTIIDKGINEWREDTYKELKEIGGWVHAVAMGTLKPSHVCPICGCISLDQEGHHEAGIKHSDLTINACKRCHRYLSERQKTWDHRWAVEDQPKHIREAFMLQGLQEILRLKARRTGNSNYEALADKYTEEVKKRLEKNE